MLKLSSDRIHTGRTLMTMKNPFSTLQTAPEEALYWVRVEEFDLRHLRYQMIYGEQYWLLYYGNCY